MPQATPDERFAKVQRLLVEFSEHPLLNRKIASLANRMDRHLPGVFLSRTLREVLQSSLDSLLSHRGVGIGRIERLLEVIERAEKEILESNQVPVPKAHDEISRTEPIRTMRLVLDPKQLTDADWQVWGELVRKHGLSHEPLGRFVRNLSEIPSGLWIAELGLFMERPLEDLHLVPGCGPARLSEVLEIIARVVKVLFHIPEESGFGVRLLPAAVRDVIVWTENVLRQGVPPNINAMRAEFIQPLLSQLETDLGTEITQMIRRRIGVDGVPDTLEEIGHSVGLTRERIRQLIGKAVEVFRVRWPEGRHLLDDLFDLLQSSSSVDEEQDLLRAIMDLCFAVDVSRGSSRDDVLTGWERAARRRLTPMTAAEVKTWLAVEFPSLLTQVGMKWVAEGGHSLLRCEGETLYFSDDPIDRLLHRLYLAGEPVQLLEAAEYLEGDERNVRLRLERDPRFLEDEYRCIHASERCGLSRENGVWQVQLAPIPGVTPRVSNLPVAHVAQLIVSGLLQAGVADATVWGVHRFATNVLRRVYGVALPPNVPPFLLASMLTRHSDGLIRTMRRRRLRWDCADDSIPVRGKRGWISFIAMRAGVPLTLDEMDSGLRESFQDYESYVIQRLNLDDDEEGESTAECRIVAGVMKRIPAIVIPVSWELDLKRENVSEGIKRLATRIISSATEKPFPRYALRRVPWLVSLCDHFGYGRMRWDEGRNLDDTNLEDEGDAELTPVDVASDHAAPEKKSGDRAEQPGGQKIKDLLSRFF